MKNSTRPPRPRRLMLALYVASAALVTVQQAMLGHSNNLSIFRSASLNLLAGGDLYAAHPEQHLDFYKYSPTFALLFAPLSALPYRTAAAVWLGINIVLYTASLVLLVRMLPIEARRDWKTWGLVPLLVTASMPFLQAAGHQQNTFLSLLILAGTVTLWRGRSAFAAGAVAGLLFYKPQLALVVAVVLAIDLGRRAVLGLGVTGMALLLLTVWAMPGI